VGSDLYHGGGQVGTHAGRAVALAQAGVAGIDVGPAFLAAQNGALGEYG